MDQPVTPEHLQSLVSAISPDATLQDVTSLAGGVSAQTTLLTVQEDGLAERRFVVRVHGEADLAANPKVATIEYSLLRVIYDAGIPVPEPIFLDQEGHYLGRPCIVISYVEGESPSGDPEVDEVARSMARHLAEIHSMGLPAGLISILPRQSDRVSRLIETVPSQPDIDLSEDWIRKALRRYWPRPPANRDALLHGDFWPGNVFWKGNEVAAVIDWEDASFGDPLGDLGNCRLELLWMFGQDAMTEFTEQYRQFAPSVDQSDLPIWDLVAALRPAGKLGTWGLDPDIERRMRDRHREFVEQAVDRLP